MILMEETEVMKKHCKVPPEMLRIRKKSTLDELSACNAVKSQTWLLCSIFSQASQEISHFFHYVSPFE